MGLDRIRQQTIDDIQQRMIDEFERMRDEVKGQVEAYLDQLNRRLTDVENRLDYCDDHHRCIKKDIEEMHLKYEKLDLFVKTLADTPMGLILDMFVVDGCSVKISEDVIGARELGVLRLFGYDSLDEFVCEALRLHLQRSRRL